MKERHMKKICGILGLTAALSISATAYGQGVGFGAPISSNSGIDISGSWTYGGDQDVDYGTAAGSVADYGGIPLNEAGRLYALAWDASRMTVRQQQCAGYGIPYAYFSPGNFRFWEERAPHTQQLVAIHMWFQTSEVRRTIWMDGRPHPPAWAPHTFAGFSTGRWDRNVLTITTTHLKRAWHRGNGVPSSDEATVVEKLIRHGDRLTVFTVTKDPVFLDEPFSKSMINLRNIKDPTAWLYACEDGEEIISRAEEKIPNRLFGKNPYLREYADKNGYPLLGTLGGGQTIHPEFAAKIKDASAAEAEAMTEIVPSHGPQQASRAVNPDPNDGEIHVWKVQGNVYMLIGDGGNIAVQVGDQGALLVDAGAGKLSDKVIAAVNKLSQHPIQFIVNTSYRPEHTGGNAKLGPAGEDPSLPGSFFGGQSPTAATGFFLDPAHHATLIAQNNVLIRMEAAKLPNEMIPADTYLEKRRRKYHNGELVEIFYQPNAVTDGDSIVQFRRSDVIATGDIYDTTRYPVIDLKSGGTVQGEINALNNILEKTGYEHDEDGGTMIIPGHGRVSDEYDVSEYRDMVSIIRDRVQAMLDAGATLDQVKAARLTADYDTRYGATSGPWTTDMFVEAIYTSLKQSVPSQARRK
jgi:glyoxylase-like metal-dependent hydrolase (beta-lactamase superfamily II)